MTAIIDQILDAESKAKRMGKSYHRVWRAAYEVARDGMKVADAIRSADETAKMWEEAQKQQSEEKQ